MDCRYLVPLGLGGVAEFPDSRTYVVQRGVVQDPLRWGFRACCFVQDETEQEGPVTLTQQPHRRFINDNVEWAVETYYFLRITMLHLYS